MDFCGKRSSRLGPEALQYCQTEGVTALRETMAHWARDKLGIPAALDHILITHDSQQVMDLVLGVFTTTTWGTSSPLA